MRTAASRSAGVARAGVREVSLPDTPARVWLRHRRLELRDLWLAWLVWLGFSDRQADELGRFPIRVTARIGEES